MSVECSYCGVEGHNRVGCKARKAAVERHRQEIASGTRPWSSLVDEQELYDRRKTKPRKCSYCANRHHEHNYDHNRRNCPRLAEDKANLVSENKKWRSDALEFMKEHGIGVGAIFDDPYYGRSLITEIRWDTISCLTQRWLENDRVNLMFTSLESLSRGKEYSRWKQFPRFENGTRWSRYSSSDIVEFRMVVPATARFIQADVPDGWSSGETGLDTYFLASNDKKC